MKGRIQLSAGTVVAGTPYRVRSLLGTGGMGSVYEVEHVELGRAFVLKILHEALVSRSDVVARMQNEWRALGALQHPNIVQVTDAGFTKERLPYFVMERLEGETVGQLLARRGRVSSREAGSIVRDVLKGLSVAHAMGAIHRDIKPQNVFVARDGTPFGTAKLLDFGIAKIRDRKAEVVTIAGVAIGTPRFMAPEQAEGRAVDGRADIYSTALVLYEMLAGKGPFSHIRDAGELVLAHIGEEPTRVDWVVNDVSPEMGDLVHRWLAKMPDSRPHDADQARRELEALLDSLPELDAPPDDVTLGGAYDAATVGPESSDETREPRATRDATSEASVGTASPPRTENAEGLAGGTWTLEPPEGARGLATMNLGTAGEPAGPAPSLLRDSQRPEFRASTTPPPTTTNSSSKSREWRFPRNRIVWGATVGSFLLSVAVSALWLGARSEDPKEGAQPAAESPVSAAPTPPSSPSASSRGKASPPAPVDTSGALPPLPSSPVSDGARDAAPNAAPGTAPNAALGEARSAGDDPKSGAARASAPAGASATAAPIAPKKTAKSKASPGVGLPGSGL